jgi:hypothetical protein
MTESDTKKKRRDMARSRPSPSTEMESLNASGGVDFGCVAKTTLICTAMISCGSVRVVSIIKLCFEWY